MPHPKPRLGDLDAKRLQRAQARAIAREGRDEKLPIVFGGKMIAELEAEFPLDTLEPIQDINVDVALLIQQAVANANAEGDAGRANMELVINILAANPDLPKELIGAVKEIGRRLLGDQGYELFCDQHPSPWDVGALIGDMFSWYGLTLGEAWRSSTSSAPDEGTSNTISKTDSVSTPEVSGDAPVSQVSSAWAGSPA